MTIPYTFVGGLGLLVMVIGSPLWSIGGAAVAGVAWYRHYSHHFGSSANGKEEAPSDSEAVIVETKGMNRQEVLSGLGNLLEGEEVITQASARTASAELQYWGLSSGKTILVDKRAGEVVALQLVGEPIEVAVMKYHCGGDQEGVHVEPIAPVQTGFHKNAAPLVSATTESTLSLVPMEPRTER